MKKLLAILGPTASGKSRLAVECAKLLGGEIVSADAYLVYRGLDIGTAKPDEAEREGIRHHLIDVVGPAEPFSVSEYEKLARAAVEDIVSRGKVPILCGGTGFYASAVLYEHAYGNAPASPEIRAAYEALARKEGNEALHARLAEVDPESAAVLHSNDVKRVIRALEIYELTGKKKSDQHDEPVPRIPFVAVGYAFPRAELYARIDARVDAMLAAGLVEEVRSLLAGGVPKEAQSMQAIGYKEVVAWLENGENCNNESTLSDIIKKNTRNYAKRQCTFFKRMELRLLRPEEGAKEVKAIYDSE